MLDFDLRECISAPDTVRGIKGPALGGSFGFSFPNNAEDKDYCVYLSGDVGCLGKTRTIELTTHRALYPLVSAHLPRADHAGDQTWDIPEDLNRSMRITKVGDTPESVMCQMSKLIRVRVAVELRCRYELTWFEIISDDALVYADVLLVFLCCFTYLVRPTHICSQSGGASIHMFHP